MEHGAVVPLQRSISAPHCGSAPTRNYKELSSKAHGWGSQPQWSQLSWLKVLGGKWLATGFTATKQGVDGKTLQSYACHTLGIPGMQTLGGWQG